MTPKEMRNRWTAALRSGDYTQGQNGLHNLKTGTYCCLGVACDLFATRTLNDDPDSRWEAFAYGEPISFTAVIPDRLQHAMGLTSLHVNMLIGMNDGEEYTFDRIADYIDTIED